MFNPEHVNFNKSVSMPIFDYAAIRPTPVVWLKYRACDDSRNNTICMSKSASIDCCGAVRDSLSDPSIQKLDSDTMTPVTPILVGEYDFDVKPQRETLQLRGPLNVSIKSAKNFRNQVRNSHFMTIHT